MKKTIIILILFLLILTSCDEQNSSDVTYPDTPEEVWGKLIESEGDYVWDTLTKEQM